MHSPFPEPSTPDDIGLPRWVKVVGILAAVLILIVGALLFIGGHGGHVPRMHHFG